MTCAAAPSHRRATSSHGRLASRFDVTDAAPRLAVLAERYLARRDTGDLFARQPLTA